jgi:O-methyltransferase
VLEAGQFSLFEVIIYAILATSLPIQQAYFQLKELVMTDIHYAAPRFVKDIGECDFYHTMDIPGVGVVQGAWDLRNEVDAYFGGVDFRNKRVLEVGPASGFLTMELEKRGATVVAFDVTDEHGWDYVPYPESFLETTKIGHVEHMRKIKNSWWFSHKAHNLKANIVYGDSTNMPFLGEFDVAVMAAILLHTRDPLQIVEQCAKRSKTIVITDLYRQQLEGAPVMYFAPNAGNRLWGNWWFFSTALFVEFLKVLGFQNVITTRHNTANQDMFTITATRV